MRTALADAPTSAASNLTFNSSLGRERSISMICRANSNGIMLMFPAGHLSPVSIGCSFARMAFRHCAPVAADGRAVASDGPSPKVD